MTRDLYFTQETPKKEARSSQIKKLESTCANIQRASVETENAYFLLNVLAVFSSRPAPYQLAVDLTSLFEGSFHQPEAEQLAKKSVQVPDQFTINLINFEKDLIAKSYANHIWLSEPSIDPVFLKAIKHQLFMDYGIFISDEFKKYILLAQCTRLTPTLFVRLFASSIGLVKLKSKNTDT